MRKPTCIAMLAGIILVVASLMVLSCSGASDSAPPIIEGDIEEPDVGIFYYVRPNAALGTYGAENGLNWDNAFNGFPSAGNAFWATAEGTPQTEILCLAGGSYTTDWDIRADNIKVVRATAAEHAGDPGWKPSFDSQVVLDSFRIIIRGSEPEDGYDNIIINGKVASGIKINDVAGSISDPIIDLSPGDEYPSTGIEFRYCEIVGASGINPVVNDRPYGGGGDYGSLIIRFCKLHNSGRPVLRLAYVNSCVLFGNVFYQRGGVNGSAVIALAQTSNIKIYNNTFVNFATAVDATPAVSLDMRNNLFYNNTADVAFGSGTRDYNWYGGADHFGEANGEHHQGMNPFRNKNMYDYEFDLETGTAAGQDLGKGFRNDMLRAIRGADGNLDRGALEFVQ